MTRRITPTAFIRAVRRTGTVPRRCLWIEDRVRDGETTVEVCAIGALCVDAGRRDYWDFALDAEDGLGLSAEYISGFITGFDGFAPCRSWRPDGVYLDAWNDGVACAIAAFEDRLHLEYRVVDGTDPSPWMDPDEEEEVPVYCWSMT